MMEYRVTGSDGLSFPLVPYDSLDMAQVMAQRSDDPESEWYTPDSSPHRVQGRTISEWEDV